MVVIVCFQSQGIVCSKRTRERKWKELDGPPNTYSPSRSLSLSCRLALQCWFFFWLALKPDNNFALWPGFMPVSHTIIPSNRLWAPKLSKHFCGLRFAMQTCWPMSKLIDGAGWQAGWERKRESESEGDLPLVALQANFSRVANVSCLSFKRNPQHNVDLNYRQLHSSIPPPQCGHKVTIPMGKCLDWHLENRYSYNSICSILFSFSTLALWSSFSFSLWTIWKEQWQSTWIP